MQIRSLRRRGSGSGIDVRIPPNLPQSTLTSRTGVHHEGSTCPVALKVPDRTQKNQDDDDSVEPVDQREEPGMAARGHQTGESQHDQQHSWQDGDHARRPQGYSLRTVVLLHAKGGWVSGSGRVPVITLPLEDEGGGPPLVGQQVTSRCYWHVLATVQRPPPAPGRLPGVSLVYDPAPPRPGGRTSAAAFRMHLFRTCLRRKRWTLMPRPC